MAPLVPIQADMSVSGMVLRNGKILPSAARLHASSGTAVSVVPQDTAATFCTCIAVVSSHITCCDPEDDVSVADVVVVGEAVRPLGVH